MQSVRRSVGFREFAEERSQVRVIVVSRCDAVTFEVFADAWNVERNEVLRSLGADCGDDAFDAVVDSVRRLLTAGDGGEDFRNADTRTAFAFGRAFAFCVISNTSASAAVRKDFLFRFPFLSVQSAMKRLCF